MICEYPFDFLASLTWASIDLIALEVLFTRIFVIDKKNNVHFKGGSGQFIKTISYVFPVMIISLIYWYISNSYQEQAIIWFCDFNYKVIPMLLSSLSFSAFFISGVNLRKRINLPIVGYSLIFSIIMFGFSVYLINYVK